MQGEPVKYQLLEPLNVSGVVTKDIAISPDGLSAYFNNAYSFVLILIAITAVFYLIYGGMVYVTTDIANKQKQGKEIIVRVITGLVFVFTVWIVLNSINPNILNNKLNIAAMNAVSGGTSPGTDVTPPGGAGASTVANPCTEGLVSVYGISVCKTIETNTKNMIDAAKSAGITLTGSGSRTVESQIALRKQNCGTTDYDIYQKPSNQCTPQTAIPGTSIHEKGLAIDFNGVNGVSTTGYQWLSSNAKNYGFYNDYNATKEYWHWSTTGR